VRCARLVRGRFPERGAGFPLFRIRFWRSFAGASVQFVDGARSQFLLADLARVELHHLLGLMAGDGHDLVRAGTSLGERGCRRVAQSVEVQIGQAERVEMGAQVFAQAVGFDRLAGLVGDKQQAGEGTQDSGAAAQRQGCRA
jgi:hypothetical protein